MNNPYATQSRVELTKLLSEKRQAWRGSRFAATGSKSANVKLARSLRRAIAQILTVLNIGQDK